MRSVEENRVLCEKKITDLRDDKEVGTLFVFFLRNRNIPRIRVV